nr:MafI family immunity protein [Streptomyces antimycoticus]
MSCLTETAEIDPSGVQEWLDHNELGLAFDDLVDLGHDRELPLGFWQHLDEAAREMTSTQPLSTSRTSPQQISVVATSQRHRKARTHAE